MTNPLKDSDLHRQLIRLAARRDGVTVADVLDAAADLLGEAEQTARAEERAKVAELHPRITLPHHHQPSPLFPDRCATCWDDGGYAAWPCPTMRAIEATP